MALNIAHSHWRRVAVRRRMEPQLIEPPGVNDHAGATAERVDLRRALTRLTRRERTVVVLRYFVDLPVDQTAHALGVSDQAIRNLSHRAIKKLRTALDDDVILEARNA